MTVIKMESSKNGISSPMPLKVTPTFMEGLSVGKKMGTTDCYPHSAYLSQQVSEHRSKHTGSLMSLIIYSALSTPPFLPSTSAIFLLRHIYVGNSLKNAETNQ